MNTLVVWAVESCPRHTVMMGWQFVTIFESLDEAEQWIKDDGVTTEYDYRIRKAVLVLEDV